MPTAMSLENVTGRCGPYVIPAALLRDGRLYRERPRRIFTTIKGLPKSSVPKHFCCGPFVRSRSRSLLRLSPFASPSLRRTDPARRTTTASCQRHALSLLPRTSLRPGSSTSLRFGVPPAPRVRPLGVPRLSASAHANPLGLRLRPCLALSFLSRSSLRRGSVPCRSASASARAARSSRSLAASTCSASSPAAFRTPASAAVSQPVAGSPLRSLPRRQRRPRLPRRTDRPRNRDRTPATQRPAWIDTAIRARRGQAPTPTASGSVRTAGGGGASSGDAVMLGRGCRRRGGARRTSNCSSRLCVRTAVGAVRSCPRSRSA